RARTGRSRRSRSIAASARPTGCASCSPNGSACRPRRTGGGFANFGAGPETGALFGVASNCPHLFPIMQLFREARMDALTLFIIRHAEKPGESWPGLGFTADGVSDTESLVLRGWQRAGAWTALFGTDLTGGDYAKPDTIYAATPGTV